MTFIKIEVKTYINKRNVHTSRKIGHFVCNQCDKNFCNKPKPKYLNSEYHFCSKCCANLACKKGGVLFKKKENNYIKKYGSTHHFRNEKIQEKRIESCVKKYGGRCPMSSKEVKDKTKNVFLQKYGDHFSRLDSIKQKKKDTCLKKYGVDSFTKTDMFKKSVDWAEVARKGLKTRSQQGNLRISKIENKFHQFLLENFSNVETQVPIREWNLDFYLPELEIYIQFDGNYWHGLDVTVEELKIKNTRISKSIIRTKERDVTRDQWFLEHKMKLVRVVEKDFKDKKYDKILEQIRGASNV